MSRRGPWSIAVAAGAAGLLALGAATATAATAPKWRITTSVKTNESADFTAVVATGKTTGWAFDGTGFDTAPIAYQLSGGKWKKAAFPGKANEEVITAGATGPANVWAFTQGFGAPSRVLHYNGNSWSVVKTFTDQIEDASVLAANDVWVYGTVSYSNEHVLGVWHYNGATWTQLSKTIQGGSALSAGNVWGFRGADVEHWNGARWTATSVKSLLPPENKQGLNDPMVVGILAFSAKSVYALGNGSDEDDGGPLVVLHYNGTKWTRVATGNFGFGPYPEISSDGSGGLWLPMMGPIEGVSRLLRYSAGKLTVAALPVAAPKITITAVSQVPGSTQQLAGGSTHAAGNLGADILGVLLKYS